MAFFCVLDGGVAFNIESPVMRQADALAAVVVVVVVVAPLSDLIGRSRALTLRQFCLTNKIIFW